MPRLLLNCDLLRTKGEERKTSCSRLGLEVPDIPPPDVGDQPRTCN